MNINNFSRAVVVCLFFAAAAFSQTNFRVDETKTQAFLQDNRLLTNLAVENNSAQFPAKIRLDILDVNDQIIAQNKANVTNFSIDKGKSSIQIPIDFFWNKSVSSLLWYRLRYWVFDGKEASVGIVSLSEIIPELFSLRVSGSQNIFAGQNYIVRVSAFHPVKNAFISGVNLNAELEIEVKKGDETEDLKIYASGVTDAEGLAMLSFQIPPDAKFSDDYWGANIKVTGEKNSFTSSANENLRSQKDGFRVFINADKPIYQPNQKISVRGLALSENASLSERKVVAGKDVEFLIKDEEDLVLYRETVKTSRFGIAAIEWQIPDNAKIGTYRVEVKSEEKSDTDYINFKVSRYELPNFIVKTKTDKDFYLPNENTAEITIDALYLFGKPVEKGTVKIVRETERRWNYLEQKFDITEEEKYEGATDADGKYTAKIDLSKTQKELADDDDEKFIDLDFTAYFTDSTSNKTEQRRFDIRVTKEPIHVYFVGLNKDDQNPKLPVEFFVTAFSARGEPLACDVEIKAKIDDDDEEKYKTVAKVKTNKFGAAKAEFTAFKDEDGDYSDLELKAVARSSDKKTGTTTQGLSIDEDEKQIVVRTEKAVYKKGESVNIEILSSENDQTVFVDVSQVGSNLESRQVKLKNGRAKLQFPYNANFKNQLTISAYFDDGGDAVKDAKGIIFPEPRNLRVGIESEKDTYKPNEEAKFDLAVFSPNKKQSENALGIVILDKAVEERAITDNSFGGGGVSTNILSDYASLLGYGGGFGGLSVNDLNELDLKKDLTKDIQLAAEVMFSDSYFDPNFFNGDYNKNLQSVFSAKINKQFEPIRKALYEKYLENFQHPTDEASMKNILAGKGINFDELRDPWGNKYRTYVYAEREYDALYIWSDGANKIINRETRTANKDDFSVMNMRFDYFPPTGFKINEAVKDYHEKTGKYVRDVETLRRVLLDKDFNLDALKDRWGESYRIEFGANGRYYTISFRSGNSDKKFIGGYDDFTIWTTQTDFFAETEAKIEAVLNNYIKEKQTFPKDEAEFKTVLKSYGIDFDELRDGWNRPFYIEMETVARFANRSKLEKIIEDSGKQYETITITPVTQKLGVFRIRTLGENGEKVTGYSQYYSNPVISTFAGIISEQAKDDGKPKIVVPKTVFANGKAAIYGVVQDANDAIIPGAKVTITNLITKAQYKTETDDEGVYLQSKLPVGRYTVQISADGFKTSIMTNVAVEKDYLSQANFTLEVGGVETVVEVTSDSAVSIDPGDTKIDTNITKQAIRDLPSGVAFSSLLKVAPNVRLEAGGFQIDGASGSENMFIVDGQEVANFRTGQANVENNLPNGKPKKETPRLREYFPETLLWMPEIVTDENGKAELKFKLADNITTWKVYAIASDLDGKIGIANKEIKAFQPFFVDLNPPRILTKGDEIFLPVQIRNYTETKQKVDVEMAKADWFSFLDADKKQIDVKQNSTENAIFGFRADKTVNEGFQKVTAYAETDSDAIEKPVEVKPDGKEVVSTKSEIFTNSINLDVDFPANALPETQSAEVKIYPNLLAHVAESVEGLLQRPYGCGEQTISSTYPNLMILRFTKENNRLRPLANKFLQKGYERLLGYQVASGGFSYWGGKEEANAALTAYALRFLTDAKGFIAVDETVIEKARNWLVSQQEADGSFTKRYNWETTYDKKRTWQMTTYIARSLAMTERGKAEKNLQTQNALQKSFEFLKAANSLIDEPYALANFGLALIDAGNMEDAQMIAAKLETMAIAEGNSAYWNLETNTPFYGWGTAGRIETTALVVNLLTRIKDQSAKNKELIGKGVMFLLKNKDRYGVWHSTQATINVLDAILATLGDDADIKNVSKQTAEIFVNGQSVKQIELPPVNELAFPVSVKIDSNLAPVNNRIEIRTGGTQAAMAQIVQTHYISWQDFTADGRNTNQSRQVRLDYKCDKLEAKTAEEITCNVEAERVGFKGYGMLLAEIGLPPGAEVDRASLEKAKDADWSFSRYDVLPDRIIIYMWSKAGGTNFNFKFKPRYGINAQTAPSVLYDYYNEEAKATLAPLRFSVK